MKNKTHRWIALTAVASIVVLAAGWFLLVSPKRSQVASLKSDAVAAEDQNTGLQLKLATLRSQQKGLAAENAALTKLGQKIPTTRDLPKLIRSLSTDAAASNVILASLTPAMPISLPAVPGISSITITIGVTGTYFDIEQYISGLESLDRGLMVSGITALPAVEPKVAEASPDLNATITAIVFTGTLTGSASTASTASTTG